MTEVTAVPIRPVRKGTLVKLWLGLHRPVPGGGGAGLGRHARPAGADPAVGRALPRPRPGPGPAMTAADVAALNYKLHVNSERAPVDPGQRGERPAVRDLGPGSVPRLRRRARPHARGRPISALAAAGHHVAGTPPPGAPFTPNDTLVFEIEMLQIAPGMAAQRQMQMMQQMMQQQQQQGGAGAPRGRQQQRGRAGREQLGRRGPAGADPSSRRRPGSAVAKSRRVPTRPRPSARRGTSSARRGDG